MVFSSLETSNLELMQEMQNKTVVRNRDLLHDLKMQRNGES
jgi:hypothetical protein